MNLTAHQRRSEIEAIVTKQQFASVSELARTMGSSSITVRRDIELLDASHRLRKVHGGALAMQASPSSSPSIDEADIAATDIGWRAITQSAIAFAEPHSSVAVNAGTGSVQLAELLVQIEDLTIVTNSLAVANVVEKAVVERGHEWVELILTGGSQSTSGALVGPTANAALERINPSVLFLSVDGADQHFGFSTNDVLEAEVNRAFLRSARQSVALVAAGQWGFVALNVIAQIDDVDILVTDSIANATPPKPTVNKIRVVSARNE
jgi:DeoR/GlpR family transcriptional regulator of sugar metabolism